MTELPRKSSLLCSEVNVEESCSDKCQWISTSISKCTKMSPRISNNKLHAYSQEQGQQHALKSATAERPLGHRSVTDHDFLVYTK